MSLRYCFEQDYVKRTLARSKKNDLAVIDSDGIPASTIRVAVDRGVFVYDYLNVGALEKGRSFYADFKNLRIAKYDGWADEWWIDPTSVKWRRHLIQEAKAKKEKGAIGLYFDNADIYWMCQEGFDECGSDRMRTAPKARAVYNALLDVIKYIVQDVGLIVMPNGADTFVRQLFANGHGQGLIRTINQEGALFSGFHRQSAEERAYIAAYMDWALSVGLYVRGIEYCKRESQIKEAKEYYRKHGWQGLYISKHTNLKGD